MKRTIGAILFERYPDRRNEIIAGETEDGLKDLSTEYKGGEVKPVFINSEKGIETLRHTTAHVMAQAVKILFPEAKYAIGPPTSDGFYYDFEVSKSFTEEDLKKIEEKMREIIEKDLAIEREELNREYAIDMFKEMGQNYKVEILKEMNDEVVSIYKQGDFIDLCRGPHLPSTGYIKAFKILSTSAVHWRGDESQKMLQRIYGTSFPTQDELSEFLERMEEARKRDHRKLMKDLELLSIQEEAGAGLVFWHPRGGIVRKIIEDIWKQFHLEEGYEIVYSPHIANINLWKKSGHLDFYRENMFSPIDMGEVVYQLKPMNCPFHILMFKSKTRSYRELPIRWAELGTVYRFERSGVLHGLLRVRGFTQDDAHIFMRPDQLKEEIIRVLSQTMRFLRLFDFSGYSVYLSTRPEKFVGTEEVWDMAESSLRDALKDSGIDYILDPGEGVFYGPKIDIKIKDVLGREWQCSTIQVDFNLPERFELQYQGEDNRPHRPIMIHRAIMGSLERFMGVLIEHYAGTFPLWLAPEQVRVMPVSDKSKDYAVKVGEVLKKQGYRVNIDTRDEKLSYKIRDAELMKIPCMVIVGEKEKRKNTVSIRWKSEGEKRNVPLEELMIALAEKSRVPSP